MTSAARCLRPFISCVVPAYNEARNLGPLLMGLCERLTVLTNHWEVIVVDDGSRDDTAAVMVPWLIRAGVRYVRLSRNFGKEAALTAGIDRANGNVVVLVDADLQHPVSLIPTMLDAWHAGADMVCTARQSRVDESWVKRLGTRLFYALINHDPSVHIPAGAGDFRLMDRRVVDALKSLPERNRFLKGLYAWVGFDTVVIPYMPPPRMHGTSHFSLPQLARLAFTGITAFTNAPLRWWGGVGAIVAAAAVSYGVYIVFDHFLFGVDVPGWSTLVAGMMFLSGVQLLSIGALGEYIGRIFDEVKQRPVYLVAHEAGQPTLSPALSRDDTSERLNNVEAACSLR